MRRPEFRNNSETVQTMLNRPDSRVLAFWRGKPLIGPDSQCLWLDPKHKLFAGLDPSVFLGMQSDAPRFAASIADWDNEWPGTQSTSGMLDQTRQVHPEAPQNTAFVNLRSVMTTINAADAELTAIAKALLDWHENHRFCPRCGSRTELSYAGWQLYCNECKSNHFCRTDPVVIMLVTYHNLLLIGRAHFWPTGMHSLLAGFIEPGETIETAVRRETLEETGVVVSHVRYLASQPWPFPASLMIGCRAKASGTSLRIDRHELECALWVSRERMAEIFAGRDATVKPPRKGSIAEHMTMMWVKGQIH